MTQNGKWNLIESGLRWKGEKLLLYEIYSSLYDTLLKIVQKI